MEHIDYVVTVCSDPIWWFRIVQDFVVRILDTALARASGIRKL